MIKILKLIVIFLTLFPFAAYAQEDKMETWAREKFGVNVPHLEISQPWKAVPLVSGCEYEWNVCWNDAKFQIKDKNEGFYRIYYVNNTLFVDFKKDFCVFWGG